MNSQSSPGAAGRTLVTIARAAEALSAAGDQITAPNVSRYVERFKESIWSEKRGRERWVDLVELMDHRRTNVRVADKQISRGIELPPAPSVAPVIPPPQSVPEMGFQIEGDADDIEPGSVGALNLALKKLELRKRQREEDLADGTVIAAVEVRELISTSLGAMITSFEQQEPVIAQRFGRDIAAAFRKCRKDAQSAAAKTLIDLAKARMPETLTGAVSDDAVLFQEDVPDTPAD